MKYGHYNMLALMFEYPGPGYVKQLHQIRLLLAEYYPETVVDIDRFLQLLSGEALYIIEELFSRSFDVQALTTLDIGYVLFGDDYKRGALLANLNREHQEAGNDCGTELADHLPNLLRLLGKLGDNDFSRELVREIITPALDKMIGEFDADRMIQKNEVYQKHYKTLIEAPSAATAYQYPLIVLNKVLRQDYPVPETRTQMPTPDFLRAIDKELTMLHSM